uniref:Anoctamin n=2 Tax=Gasterosteus aculeatus aculeatus TaxID=481459 RepID=A0AAQ4RYU0_GASAC|nr:anoctamin-1-like isoform X1 [Gasterosteus aculeatus aculeatus]XP_040024886.1 anoctamin-1-like isoform X1 [Gasterosteus aculeatus aculeatus]XP_040024887.1 anoctamin-1-like isoform X1 [Gasterosteus aculeatus aculeatus]
MPVTTDMSESLSCHSVKLVSLARSLSELGVDAANGIPVTPPENEEPPLPESGIDLGPGLFFADGKRKVDYVLCYKLKKRHATRPRLSITSNGSIPLPVLGRWETEAESGDAGAPAGDLEESKLSEEEKAVMREEFEAGLLDAGVQLQRDKERANGLGFIRLHIPWPILSREAELQKIKVPVKKKCELRKRMGVAGLWDSIMRKVNILFQPDVPDFDTHRDSQTRVHFKTLKHPFIRDKLHLYDIKSTDTVFNNATRSRIVAEIISRVTCNQTCQTTGINSLLARGVYDSAFPVHDGSFTRRGRKDQRNDRQILHEEWANYGVMHKYQPVDLIRKYFGEQIGLYFAWLGVYTQLLIPPSVLGIIVFLYGIFTVDANVPSQETCDDNLNITMCPLCDGVCDYWRLSTVCSLARASYLFDNGVTVLFAIFMSLWAACFLEHWKRRQMCLKHTWDLTSLEDEEDRVQEELRPEYEEVLQEKKDKMKAQSKKKLAQAEDGVDRETDQMLASQREPESLDIEDHLSGYLINVSTLLLLIFVTFSAVVGVAVYRICMLSVWSMNPDPEAKASVRMTVTTTGIILNMLVVLVLEEVYGAIAVWLTELELPKTKEEFEEKLIFKSFFLKSMNAFAPIFYVAFFKGRFGGRPGDYVYVFGDYRIEECAPPGCLIELCIQLSMIMLGKQLIQNNVFEVLIPKLKKMYRTILEEKVKKRAAENEENATEEKRPRQQFDKDYALEPYEGVTPEYMEMIIQYGFVSLFVASFPLAPAFALLNNVIEIRLDAAKFVTEIRRPDAVRCKDIGIWYNILCGISKFSVITNAFVISFTSEFVPRMVYQYMYSVNGTMNGYTEHSLSYFNVSNFPPGSAPTTALVTGVSMCRYKDYRDPPWDTEAYTFSKQYWSVLAAKLAFVIFFQNLAMFLSMLVAWMIPDVPRSLREQLMKENMMLMEFLLNQDQEARAKSPSPKRSIPPFNANIDIVVEAPPEDVEEQRVEEERVEINLDETRRSGDSEPEVGKSLEEVEENGQERQRGEGEDEVGEVEVGEMEKDGDQKKEDGYRENKQAEAEGKEKVAQSKEEQKEVDSETVEKEDFIVDLDAIMSELGLLDDNLSTSTPRDTEFPRSESEQQYQKDQQPLRHLSSETGSGSQMTSDSSTGLIAAPPREQGLRGKARCFTLPSRSKGAEARYSLPRPSHSASLPRPDTLAPVVPLAAPSSSSSNPCPPLHTSVSPSSSSSSPPATPCPSAQRHRAPGELFALEGPPPPQQPRPRGKVRCSTLPPRHRAAGAEEPSTKPSHSTSLTKLHPPLPR